MVWKNNDRRQSVCDRWLTKNQMEITIQGKYRILLRHSLRRVYFAVQMPCMLSMYALRCGRILLIPMHGKISWQIFPVLWMLRNYSNDMALGDYVVDFERLILAYMYGRQHENVWVSAWICVYYVVYFCVSATHHLIAWALVLHQTRRTKTLILHYLLLSFSVYTVDWNTININTGPLFSFTNLQLTINPHK